MVRRTFKPNLEPPEPPVGPQKPNLEPTEPQNTEPNLELNQVRPNISVLHKKYVGTRHLCRTRFSAVYEGVSKTAT